MKQEAYYNDNDLHAARWLRNLADAGHIHQGVIDGWSIHDVKGVDVRDYRECHFFAGIGGWPLALRLAGWPADRPVWTGSCPCQPYSAAGKGEGDKDPRNLWPQFRRLIAECHPPTIFGEQVESKAGRLWYAGVRADLEALGYAVGCADLCAAGTGEEAQGWIVRGGTDRWNHDESRWENIVLGPPHVRQRLFWVADSVRVGIRGGGRGSPRGAKKGVQGADGEREWVRPEPGPGGRGLPRGLDDAGTERRFGGPSLEGSRRDEAERGQEGGHPGDGGLAVRLGDAGREGLARPSRQSRDDAAKQQAPERAGGDAGGLGGPALVRWVESPAIPPGGPERGQPQGCEQRSWYDFDVVPCRDGKARRIESGTFPLAHGVPGRVGKLRAYGNAFIPEVAAEFVRAYLAID